MPPRNTQEGFKERNQYLGTTWTNLEPEEKDIFNGRMFFSLGYLASGWDQPPVEPGTVPLDAHDADKYLPIFKRLVNLDKVARDLGQAKFGPHLPTTRQNKGIEEVERIEHEVKFLTHHPFLH
ncbi:hypothetical protein DFH28DRAFT_287338 [Melampsora americana]|nr:hypothetical protein DFH28DRAFT_287338 [Melampsora americana]